MTPRAGGLAVLAALAVGACAPEPPKVAAAPPAPKCEAPPAQLMTRDLAEGTGDPIPPRSAVLVNYTGWLYDPCKPDHKGEKFDTSEGRSTPFGFIVGYEIYDHLEKVVDRFEDVANRISGIVIENI